MATKVQQKAEKSSQIAPVSPIASCQRSYATAAARALNSPRASRRLGREATEHTHLPPMPILKVTTPESEHNDIFSPALKGVDAEGAGRSDSPTRKFSVAVTADESPRTDVEAAKRNGEVQDDGDDSQEEEEEEWNEFNPYYFIKTLPPYKEAIANRIVPTLLPKRTRSSPPMTLVLDLDETLVHCSIEPIANADIQFRVDFGGLMYQVYVRKRPYLHQFLEAVSKKFEVIVFTASQQIYAEKLLNLIDPRRKLIKYRLYRDSCLEVCDNFLKDLNVLGRDLKSTIIVDNSPHAFGYQVSNGIPIGSWFDDVNDTELHDLLPLLNVLHSKDDVRPHIREFYQLHKTIEAS